MSEVRTNRQAAALVDSQLHQRIRSPEQIDSPEYDRAVLPLVEFHRSVPEIYYIYTMLVTEAVIRFVLDTSTRPTWLAFDREMEPSAPMDVYQDPGQAIAQAFRLASVATDHEPYSDEFGTFLSGYAPILRDDGTIEAMVGVDLDLSGYNARLAPVTRAAWTAGAMSWTSPRSRPES